MVEKKQTDWEKQEKNAKEGKESGEQKKKKNQEERVVFFRTVKTKQSSSL